jgi:drug/metabolite transporter (DMT)-like permease
MTPIVLIMVLSAALLHASWNAIVKASGDRTSVLGLISLGHVIFGIVLAFNVPLPAPESWPFLAASTIIHFGYYYLLHRSYGLGDLSEVYPIARGISPILITLGALVFAGENLPLQSWIAIILVSIGILMLSSNAWKGRVPPVFLATALTTGLFIAAYSLTDGLGARVSGAPLGYIAWLFILEVFVTLFVFSRRGLRMFTGADKLFVTGITGGAISALAYGLVIYAKTLSPLGVVSTLRETSVLFAAFIGIILLGERPWQGRMVAAAVVASGVLLLALA